MRAAVWAVPAGHGAGIFPVLRRAERAIAAGLAGSANENKALVNSLSFIVHTNKHIVLKRAETSRNSPRPRALSTNFYRILGLRPGADGTKIKAAYRTLAKQFHPDFNAGDTAAEQRTKDINCAYQTLGDPEARVAYDAELARQRAEARSRFWTSMAMGVATFMLTASLVPLLVLLKQTPPNHPPPTLPNSQGGETRPPDTSLRRSDVASDSPGTAASEPVSDPSTGPRQEAQASQASHQQVASLPSETARTGPGDEEAQTGDKASAGPVPVATAHEQLAHTEVANLAVPETDWEQQPPSAAPDGAPAAASRAKPALWTLYQNTHLGFALRYPADVFTLSKGEVGSDDRLLMSKDGRALLRISAMPNRAPNTAAEYRRSLVAERYADATFDYVPQRGNWFVLSGTVGGEMFYERVTFSCDRRSIHGWLLVYPVAERLLFDAIVEEMHRHYRYQRCDPAKSGRAHALDRPEKAKAATDVMPFE